MYHIHQHYTNGPFLAIIRIIAKMWAKGGGSAIANKSLKSFPFPSSPIILMNHVRQLL